MTTYRLILLTADPVPDHVVRERVPTWIPGSYVQAYDPNEGIDSLVVTDDADDALAFDDAGEVTALWCSVNETDPVRPDGRPNRPLTSFTMLVDKQ